MKSLQFLLTVFLLVVSSQSSALFMPADHQVGSSDDVATTEVGC